jgi:spermidine synthase
MFLEQCSTVACNVEFNFSFFVMCMSSTQVVEVSKRHFKDTLATGYFDPKVTMIYDDAVQYVKDCKGVHQFDCIICDSSDPIGPAASLFTPAFYTSMRDVLSPGGVITTQGECQWLYLDLIANVVQTCCGIFDCARYAYASVPSYPSGQIGFIVCSNDSSIDGSVPLRQPSSSMELQYYSPEMHQASFVLPVFAAKSLPQKKSS